MSVALEGAWWFLLLYGWLWSLRYPNTRPPAQSTSAERPKRRAANE
jgi:hypothetical protein